jgi:hypothetical protein
VPNLGPLGPFHENPTRPLNESLQWFRGRRLETSDRLGGAIFLLATAPWCGPKSLVALGPRSVVERVKNTSRGQKGQTDGTRSREETEGRRSPEFEGPSRFLSVSRPPFVMRPLIVLGD